MINVGSTAAISILVLHAQDNLHLDEVGFGLLLAAAVGGILGAQAHVVIKSFGRRASVLGAVGVLGFGVAGMGWAGGILGASLAHALFGVAVEIWNVVSVT